MRDLECQRLEIDEIWTFVYAKKKNVPAELKGGPYRKTRERQISN